MSKSFIRQQLNTNLTPKQLGDMQTYIASLYFLSKEAEKSELTIVQKIIERTIFDINHWMEGENYDELLTKLVDNNLMNMISFLLRASLLDKGSLNELIRDIDSVVEEKKRCVN